MGRCIYTFLFASFLLLSGYFQTAYAQVSTPEYRELLFLKNHFSTGLGTNYFFATHQLESGPDNMKVSSTPSVTFHFKYHINLHDNIGINIGADMGVQNLSYHFSLKASEYNLPYDISHSQNIGKPYLSIPLTLNPRFMPNPKYIMGFSAGIQLHYYFPSSGSVGVSYFDEPTGNTQQVFNMQVDYMKANPYLNYTFGFHHGIVLQNLDILQFALRYNLGNKTLLRAEYEFSDSKNIIGSGALHSKNDYFSFELTYIFTKAKHMRRKIHNFKKG